MHGTSSPLPEMIEWCRMSVTLHVKKYQLTLDISLGTCTTVFPSFVIATANESRSLSNSLMG